jgi:hypothetical protein
MKVFTINASLLLMKKKMSDYLQVEESNTRVKSSFGLNTFNLLVMLFCYFAISSAAFSQSAKQDSKSMPAKLSMNKASSSDPYTAIDKMRFMALEQAFFKAFRNKDLVHLQPYYTEQDFYLTRSKHQQETQSNLNLDPIQNDRASVEKLKAEKNAADFLASFPQQIALSQPDLGWGRLVLNGRFDQSIFLQIPHRFHDKYTETIGQQWWKTNLFHLVMVNSAHRHQGKKQNPAINSDFSTAPYNPFLAATRAYIRAFKQPFIVQLHGFNRQKRKTDDGRNADIILSHGVKLPSPLLNKLDTLAACIKKIGFSKVKIYPQQVTELGATKNIIGDALRQQGYLTQFLHIEMSKTVRKKLVQNEELSMKMAQCVYQVGS